MVTNRDRKSFGSRRKNSKFAQTTDVFDPRSGISGHNSRSFRVSKSSRMLDRVHSREMYSCSGIDLAQIRRSFKINLWIWSIISGVVTVFGRQGRGTSQVEKLPRLNWATEFLTVAYDGACSPNVSVRMAWISFGSLPCRGGEKKELDDSSRLDVVEIARVAWHASFQPL